MKKHLHIGLSAAIALVVTTAIFIVSFALPAAPDCEGTTATIWVDGSNMIQPANVPYLGTLDGTAGDDVIVGTSGDDIINGDDGNDVICALGGNDTIGGGKNKDTSYGGSGDDDINGAGGADTIFGGLGNDTIQGKAGKDIICAGLGDDTIDGGNKEDKIDADGGNDTIDGGNDSDICLNGDVSTVNCEDTTTVITECAGETGGGAGGSSRDNRRSGLCGDGNLDSNESCDDGNRTSGDGCNSYCKLEDGYTIDDESGDILSEEELKEAAEEEEEQDENKSGPDVCFDFNLEKPLPTDISAFYYYFDDAVALYSTYLNETDPAEYLVAGFASLADQGEVNLLPNYFITRMDALELALKSNCYFLQEDIWAQGVEMGLVEEDADPEEFITVSEGRTMLTTAAGVDLQDYYLEDYIPGNTLLNRDAWGMAADLIPMSANVDEESKQLFSDLLK